MQIEAQRKLEQMFIDAVQNFLFPSLEDDKQKNKELADQMKNVLLAVGYTDSDIKNLIKKAKGE